MIIIFVSLLKAFLRPKESAKVCAHFYFANAKSNIGYSVYELWGIEGTTIAAVVSHFVAF
jgi:hypothetical protein